MLRRYYEEVTTKPFVGVQVTILGDPIQMETKSAKAGKPTAQERLMEGMVMNVRKQFAGKDAVADADKWLKEAFATDRVDELMKHIFIDEYTADGRVFSMKYEEDT